VQKKKKRGAEPLVRGTPQEIGGELKIKSKRRKGPTKKVKSLTYKGRKKRY